MSNLNNVGKFIKELRKEAGLSQQALAEKLYIGREAVSKWERGMNLPTVDVMISIAEFFHISLNELVYGARETKENKEKIKNITITLYEANQKQIKYLNVSIVLLIIISLLFFSYYFINNYNSIKVYTLGYHDEDVTIQDGILVTTREKVFLNIGNIKTKEEIENIEFLIGDKVIYKTDDIKDTTIYDYNGFERYFNFDNLKNEINDLYLNIYLKDENKKVKLSLTKRFTNDNIINTSNKHHLQILDDNANKMEEIEKIIKEIFTLEENTYIYNSNKEYKYLEESKSIFISEKLDNNISKWKYNILTKGISYEKYDKDYKLIESYEYMDNILTCSKKDCSEYEDNIKNLLEDLDYLLFEK